MKPKIPYGYEIRNGLAYPHPINSLKLRDFFNYYVGGLPVLKSLRKAGVNCSEGGGRLMLMNETYLGTDYYPKLIEKKIFEDAKREMRKRGAHLIGRAGRKDKEAVAVQTEFVVSTHHSADDHNGSCGDPSSLYSLIQLKNPPQKKKKAVRHKGGYIGAAPYGFERLDGKLVEIETEAALIREIFDTVGSGTSLIRVASDLNERNIPTKRGKKWMEGTIKYIIHNPVYVDRIITAEVFDKASAAVQKNCKGGGRKRQFFTQNINDEKTGQIGALGEMPGAVFMNKCITS